jgi:hypothetical protein
MHARLTTLDATPDRMDDVTREVQEHVLPQLQQQDGFKGFIALRDRGSGRVRGVPSGRVKKRCGPLTKPRLVYVVGWQRPLAQP